MYIIQKQVNLAIVPSQIMPGRLWRPFSKMAAISETKRRRTFNFDSIYRFCEAFYKMAAISKVIRLSQKLRGAEPSMLTLYIGFVGRRFQKKYCRIHHANVSAILEAILQKMVTIFNVMRLKLSLKL